MKANIIPLGNYGKITLPQVIGVGPGVVITGFTIIVIVMFYLFERKNL
jgi:hypothetical protein